MSKHRRGFQFYRVLEDKTEVELAVVSVSADNLKVAIPSQFIDLRDGEGNTFVSLTFPSWVKVRNLVE